ncbi:hypothetical protein N7528_009172 [Penicillium herquei]|nr:hypothetical protein N7528_009172 [Penicillium herquei]
MTEDIDLDVLKSDLTPYEADALRILKEALTSQPNPAAASAQLARTLREHCLRFESLALASTFLEHLWMVLLDVLAIVPIDHPWHSILITAVDDLRHEGGPIVHNDTEETWDNLPGLRMYLFDKFAEDPTDTDDTGLGDIEIWKRWTSFAACVAGRGCRLWDDLAWREIRDGLETDSHNEPTSFDPATVFECKVWIAAEWIIQLGGIPFQELNSTKDLDARDFAAIKPGPLCEDIPRHSVQRWDFWLSRLVELADKKSTTRLKDDTPVEVVLSASCLLRLNQAIAAMHKCRSEAEAEGQPPEDQDRSRTG